MHKLYISPILHINPIPVSLLLEVLVSVVDSLLFPLLSSSLFFTLLPSSLSFPPSIYPADGDGPGDKVFGLVTSIDLLSFICNKKQ